MKMQEVITQLREIAPGVALNTKSALNDFDQLRLMLSDALRANSVESVRALVQSCSDKAKFVLGALERARDKAEQLQRVNAAYKERLGPRTKKPKDCPGQMDLFDGQSTANDTSVTSRKCPRCKASALGCEFFDNGVCKGVVYPTNPPQYDPCVFCSGSVRQ